MNNSYKGKPRKDAVSRAPTPPSTSLRNADLRRCFESHSPGIWCKWACARGTLKRSEPILFLIISSSLHPVSIQFLMHLSQISFITHHCHKFPHIFLNLYYFHLIFVFDLIYFINLKKLL